MKEQVLKTLKAVLPTIDFESSKALVDDGVLDSLSIVNVVTAISTEFNINFEIDEITPENFNSIDAMVKLIEKHQ